MNRETWRTVCDYVFRANDIVHFAPDEVVRVGKRATAPDGTIILAQAPPPALLNNVLMLARFLEIVRERVGVPLHVNSWYRSPEYNAVVSVAERSLHPLGVAADFWASSQTPLALARGVLEMPEAPKLGVGLYRSFVHVDIRGFVGRADVPARWGVGVDPDWWR